MVMALKKGKRPWKFCFNPKCPTNAEWQKKREEYAKQKEEEAEKTKEETEAKKEEKVEEVEME